MVLGRGQFLTSEVPLYTLGGLGQFLSLLECEEGVMDEEAITLLRKVFSKPYLFPESWRVWGSLKH